MLRFWTSVPMGIYSASLKQRDTKKPLIYGQIQSVHKRASEFGLVDLIIIYECDLVSPKEETMYQRFINELRNVQPNLRVVGFTATPYRLGTGCLTELELWDEICIDLTKTERFNWFIEHGYLSPLINKRACKEIDVTNVAIKGGEFDEHDPQEAADTDELNKAVVDECIRYGADRKHWLVFASGIKHGERLCKLFNARGIPTVMLTGKDSETVRETEETKFRSGEYRCLINVGLYGRGWDFPALDLIAWARATQSVQLWVQGCVRGTRVFKMKEACVVLDFAGNTRRLGPVNMPITPKPRRKGDAVVGEAPVKECPECHSYVHTRVMECPDCGYVFPPPSTVKKTADTADILKRDQPDVPQIEEFIVVSVGYRPTVSKNGNRYLKVTHSTGLAHFNESLFFGHEAVFLQKKCRIWWLHRGGLLPIPASADEAAERAPRELNLPSIIRVNVAPKWPEIVGCEFDPLATQDDADNNEPF